jgi:hypothetical protein
VIACNIEPRRQKKSGCLPALDILSSEESTKRGTNQRLDRSMINDHPLYNFTLRLGILEKKKDFQRRAKHLHNKKSLLDSLKQKAFLRNPEEFAYGMINASTNSAGQVLLASKKSDNPNALKSKPDYDAKRHRILEPRTDGQGKVPKFKFERRK